LRVLVDRLERGQLGLEASLAAFEEGVGLARQGAKILDEAERRVEILTKTADGQAQIQPFSDGEQP
jgi:exodeoxyribonuclease VII small subunit